LQSLQDHSESVWLDYVRCSLLTSGEPRRLIEEGDLRGLASNPSIFEKAIAGSDYRDILQASESQSMEAKRLYERIAVRDIHDAADDLTHF
jgi:transaldolase/glucose-6-phosphate isomerase